MLVYVNVLRLAAGTGRDDVLHIFSDWMRARGFDPTPTDLHTSPANAAENKSPTGQPPALQMLYSARYTHADPAIVGRSWITELGLVCDELGQAREMSVLIATVDKSTRAAAPVIDVVPSFIETLAEAGVLAPETPGLHTMKLADAWAAEALSVSVHSPVRAHVLVIMSTLPDDSYAIDPEVVRRALVGLGDVIVVPPNANTHTISRTLGHEFSAWKGAISIILAPRGESGARTVKLLPNALAAMGGSTEILGRIVEVVTHRSNIALEAQHISPEKVQRGAEIRAGEILTSIISKGEGPHLEFKSSLRWNVQEKRMDEAMTDVVLKTIASFLNSDGGTLLIGVADDGTICGIEHDRFDSVDKFLLTLVAKINSQLGPLAATHVVPQILRSGEHAVCAVECTPVERLVFLRSKGRDVCYVRQGPRSTELPVTALIDYDRARRISGRT